jgi:(p)ppGpp synthase/HD superfamily hydrolase
LANHPYILHPLRVMLAMTSADERIAAVLHDVVEDTDVTIEDLRFAGFSETVLTAIAALTKTPGESRMSAAHRAVQNPIARTVKLADVGDNMNLDRIAHPTEKDFARLKEYEEVRALLVSHGQL